MDYDNKIIGANIHYERQLKNMSIDEAAEMLDMAPFFLGLLERGQREATVANLISFSFPLTLC
ncbi:MAG: helix-turn-helix domain-containing protein [Clostridiales bacterium]|nr:helix-turn-helix domain-containing protein [Clostridiales bacterium]